MTRTAENLSFTTHDGVSLFYRRWPASTPARRGAIVLFHRGHEHGGRMAHLVDELDLPDFDFYAWDARGHGLSPGERGDSPGIGHSVRDIQTFVDHLCNTFELQESDIAVIAQSVGAVLTSAWAHDYAPRIRCQVLASPAFKVKLYVPFARPGLKLLRALRGNFFVNSYVKSKYLTHDPERQKSFDSDPLISRAISVNILLGLDEAAKRVVSDAEAIAIPTQLLISSDDWVVHHWPQHEFFARLGTTKKEKHVLPGFYHDTLGEMYRADAVGKARDFILRQFDAPLNRPSLRDEHQHGHTFEEAKNLSIPFPPFSPKGLYWSTYRFVLKLVGHLSDGVRLGHATGFDSGSSLDYIYRNTPSGKGFFGQIIDRIYLDAIGWRGIRQRKCHLEEILKKVMNDLEQEKRPVRILDIAAGHGRYVLDALQYGIRPESILLRDFSEENVEKGNGLIAERRLQDIARFEKGDAFDRENLAAIAPKATVGIVSGLYELFADNDRVAASLGGLHDAIEKDGYLIYTGQPWHPQLEMIARALTSHRDGVAWVMRRRTQAEMDQLVQEAGFEKIEQRIDEWGIFSVSLARRKGK
ncbi:MAG: bifunctional alpha/beta hydrolase/class I SAM-dependent methyltransferase [Xanthomonadaceae bacterium]|jgi:alpha-beta hydrolase superfamily lysophospholipase/SAM-dependent methyltransferase|nr:bifunctional alpha/beta hydrolase/class I SAM-dependent methyltransferase [Xanthomonadaceae bacterium]